LKIFGVVSGSGAAPFFALFMLASMAPPRPPAAIPLAVRGMMIDMAGPLRD